MSYHELSDFTGGVNTGIEAHAIPDNQGVFVSNAEINTGSIKSQRTPYLIGAVAGHNARYYKAQDKVVYSTEDRFYVEIDGFLYWSNPAGVLKRYDGTTINNLGGHVAPTVVMTAVSSATAGMLDGDYTYTYTYVHTGGFESPPAPFTNAVTIARKQGTLTFTDTPPASATHRKIYRAGGINPTFNHVVELPIATLSHTDIVADMDLSREELVTHSDDPAPAGLDMLIENSGVLWGALNDMVYFSRQGQPEYWSAYNFVKLPQKVDGLGVIGGSVIAWAGSSMYKITGSSINDVSLTKLPFQYGCANKRTVKSIEGVLIWVSTLDDKDAICIFDGGSVREVTGYASDFNLPKIGESAYSDYDTETYLNFSFNIKNAAVSNKKYFLFLDGRIVCVDFTGGGSRIYYFSETVEGAYSKNESLIIIRADGNEYAFFPDFSGYRNVVYKTGTLTSGSLSTLKRYRQVKTHGEGDYTIFVLVDGVVVAESSEKKFFLESELCGNTIQFIIKSNGYAKINTLGYEYAMLQV